MTLHYAPGRWRCGFGLLAVAAYAGVLLIAIVSCRYGVMWINHAARTCIEVDVGAVHGLWIAKTASSAFAPSGVELIDHGRWNGSGWRPRFDCASPGKVYVAMPLWLLGLPLLAPFFVRRGAAPLSAGVCRGCRYDSNGHVSGRCPECGTLFDNGVSPLRPGSPIGRNIRHFGHLETAGPSDPHLPENSYGPTDVSHMVDSRNWKSARSVTSVWAATSNNRFGPLAGPTQMSYTVRTR